MIRERALKVVLVILGLLFFAAFYPALMMHPDPADAMLGVVYATLGVFLVLAAWNTSANRSLIAFTAWSSFAHGGIMALQAWRNEIPHRHLVVAVLPFVIIGIVLIVLAPAKARAGS